MQEQGAAKRIMSQMSSPDVDWTAYHLPNTFAVSYNQWVLGLIILTGEGGVNYDPKSDGSSVAELFKAAGKIQVPFEDLIVHLSKKGIEFNSKELAKAQPLNLSKLQLSELEQYLKNSAELGHSIAATILAATE